MNVLGNKIAYASYQDQQILNNIVFLVVNIGCSNNTFGNNCSKNTFGDGCSENTFGNDCRNNNFGDNCKNNTFGNSCYDNVFDINCSENTFGNDCYSNAFVNSCSKNTFDDNCTGNAFGRACLGNTFDNSCQDNTFGDNCKNNTFGNSCENNTFGISCQSNAFGDNCTGNAFGDNCQNNTFGNDCADNTFGDNCQNNTFGNSCYSNTFDHCYANVLEFNCGYLKGMYDETEGTTAHSYHVLQSTHGTSVEELYELPTKPDTVLSVTYVGMDSSGNITTWILAEVNNGGSGGSATPMESITWSELKVKRDGGTLTPGMQYRITDYVCTTTQAESRAVSHPYDIIVTADKVNVLNENARACLHDGDDYYTAEGHSANLAVWELKYCLDNDETRFGWADTENGKGVVYYLKDEHNNECPYDFKQIQFKRYRITECEKVPSIVGAYTAPIESTVITGIDENNPVWGYTFCYYGNNLDDATVLDAQHYLDDCGVFGNKIAPAYNGDLMVLNNIVFITITDGCYGNTFDEGCGYNTFSITCCNNAFGYNCHSNIFNAGCTRNAFNNSCVGNIFSTRFKENTFGNECHDNIFGNECHDNIFGNDCHDNIFGNDCSNNIFGNNSYSNTFSNNCYNNTLGNSCPFNSFGSNCHNNILENTCGYLKGTYDETNGTSTHSCHALAGTRGLPDRLYELPTNLDSNKSVTYVGMKSNGNIITWVPADVHDDPDEGGLR